jgi:hypothetical protein
VRWQVKPNLMGDNSELKMSFAFDHDKVITPWITVANGDGKFLNAVKFTITYSGEHITKVRWVTDYNTEPVHHSQWPKSVWLHYSWVELIEQDVQYGAIHSAQFPAHRLAVPATLSYLLYEQRCQTYRRHDERGCRHLAGLNVLFLGGFALALAVMVCAAIDSQVPSLPVRYVIPVCGVFLTGRGVYIHTPPPRKIRHI